jgi:hypothetical protein
VREGEQEESVSSQKEVVKEGKGKVSGTGSTNEIQKNNKKRIPLKRSKTGN